MKKYMLQFTTIVILLFGGEVFAQYSSNEVLVASLQSRQQPYMQDQTSSVNRTEHQKLTLESGALFGHNKSDLSQMSEQGRREIYFLAVKLKAIQNMQSMTISGHSDVTNGTGIMGYNEKLSLQRASAVRDYLAELGFDVSRIKVVGMGALQPVKHGCSAPKGVIQTTAGLAKGLANKEEMDAFRQCLEPNRRVEVEIFGATPPAGAASANTVKTYDQVILYPQ
jgi:outer membrane protein OmpA-like peptidoglycan-associated protein